MLNKLLDGFDGKLNSSKWAKIAKCSQDTAGRDINDLLNRGVLKKEAAGGRSTSYILSQLAIAIKRLSPLFPLVNCFLAQIFRVVDLAIITKHDATKFLKMVDKFQSGFFS